MATGKTNARWMRLIVDGVNLSGDSRQISSFGVRTIFDDQTGWSDGIINFSLGQKEHILEGYQAIFNNTATTGAFSHLKTPAERVVSLPIGIRAAPAIGDPTFLTSVEQLGMVVDGIMISANFAKAITDSDLENAWGVLLANGTSLSATTDGASVDNGASTANGLLAHCHVVASTGGTWTIKVQDSPDDAVWGDLITFSADGSAVASERGEAAGTIDRYLRFQATRTSGDVSIWISAVRQ